MGASVPPAPPEALVLIGPGCPHCAVVLEGLCSLVKAGALTRLEVVYAAHQPARAQALGVRTVPWTRIGPFALTGSLSLPELRRWAELAGTDAGTQAYLQHLLATGELSTTERFVRQTPGALSLLIALLPELETPIQVRIGIGAVIEGLAGSELLAGQLEALGGLLGHPDARVRADACHYLALTGAQGAKALLQSCLSDEDREVREIAREGLELIGARDPDAGRSP